MRHHFHKSYFIPFSRTTHPLQTQQGAPEGPREDQQDGRHHKIPLRSRHPGEEGRPRPRLQHALVLRHLRLQQGQGVHRSGRHQDLHLRLGAALRGGSHLPSLRARQQGGRGLRRDGDLGGHADPERLRLHHRARGRSDVVLRHASGGCARHAVPAHGHGAPRRAVHWSRRDLHSCLLSSKRFRRRVPT